MVSVRRSRFRSLSSSRFGSRLTRQVKGMGLDWPARRYAAVRIVMVDTNALHQAGTLAENDAFK